MQDGLRRGMQIQEDNFDYQDPVLYSGTPEEDSSNYQSPVLQNRSDESKEQTPEELLRKKLPKHLQEASLEWLEIAMSTPPDILEKLKALETKKKNSTIETKMPEKKMDQFLRKLGKAANQDELSLIKNSESIEELSRNYKNIRNNSVVLKQSLDLIRKAYFTRRRQLETKKIPKLALEQAQNVEELSNIYEQILNDKEMDGEFAEEIASIYKQRFQELSTDKRGRS